MWKIKLENSRMEIFPVKMEKLERNHFKISAYIYINKF